MENRVEMPTAPTLGTEPNMTKHRLIYQSVDDLDNVISRLDDLIAQIKNEPGEEKVSPPSYEASLEQVLKNSANEISHKVSAMHERIDVIKDLIF